MTRAPDPADVRAHWSRQEIVKTIINAMAEANGKVKAVPAGKAADHILEYLAPALRGTEAPPVAGMGEDLIKALIEQVKRYFTGTPGTAKYEFGRRIIQALERPPVAGMGEELRIGDKVEVIGEYEADFRGEDWWVAGIRVHDSGEGLDVTITEQWPIPNRHWREYRGQTDGFRPEQLRVVEAALTKPTPPASVSGEVVTQADVDFANEIISGFRKTSGCYYADAKGADHWIAKAAARLRLAAAPEAATPSAAPVAWVSPGQFTSLVEPDEIGGAFLPVRKTKAGNFTQPLYAAPSAVGDVQRLRSALISCGRHAGAILADAVSTDFLMHVPEEVRLKIAALGGVDRMREARIEAIAFVIANNPTLRSIPLAAAIDAALATGETSPEKGAGE